MTEVQTAQSSLKSLFVIKTITVYGDKGLKNRRFSVGSTIKGKFDGLIGGYRCMSDDGLEFMVFHHEVEVI